MSSTGAVLTRYLQNGPLADLYDKVMEGRRLGFDDGVRLWESDDLAAVGALANIARENKTATRLTTSATSTSITLTCATRAAGSARSTRKKAARPRTR